MKHLLLTTALVTATATGAFAEGDKAAKDSAHNEMFRAESMETELHASNFIGMRVYASEAEVEEDSFDIAQDEWEDIGEINDVILSREGDVQAVLVDIGGFLGIGERQVAVEMDQIKFVSDSSTADDNGDFFLVLNADRATLEGAPEYGALDRAAEETEQELQQAANAAGNAMNNAEEEVEQAAEATGNAMENAGEEIEQTAEAAGQEIEEGAEAVERTAEAAAEETGEALEQTADATETAVENAGEELEQTAEAADNAMDEAAEDLEQTAEAAEAETEETIQAAEAETNGLFGDWQRDGYADVEQEYLTTENLTGARVYDTNDEWVGEISELLITEDGQITDAIIDVGGFLGIGEKPVALQLTDLKIMREDGGDDVRVYTAMAEEELEAMPEFED